MKLLCGICEKKYEVKLTDMSSVTELACPHCNATFSEQMYNKFVIKTVKEVMGKKYVVSTVNLIIEHPYNLYYETMIYREGSGEFLELQWRYKSKDKAVQGHKYVVNNLEDIIRKEIVETL